MSAGPATSVAPSAYRLTFTGPSLGTEQELMGVKLTREPAATAVVAEVIHVATNAMLVQVTTDMGGGESYGGQPGFTPELKTSPTEVADQAGWVLRNRAIGALVGAVNARIGAGPVTLGTTDAGAEFRVEVRAAARHSFHRTTTMSHGISSMSNQATYGIPIADVPDAFTHGPLAEASWFQRGLQLTAADKPADPVTSLALYSLVASVTTQLAELTEHHRLALDGLPPTFDGKLLTPSVKDAWGVLPRTPVWDTLTILGDADQRIVKAAVRALPAPKGVSSEVWDAARKHITNRMSLAGHDQKSPTIEDKPGILFEFRSNVPEVFSGMLYHLDGTQPVAPIRPPAPQPVDTEKNEKAAARRRLVRGDSDSESESDSEW